MGGKASSKAKRLKNLAYESQYKYSNETDPAIIVFLWLHGGNRKVLLQSCLRRWLNLHSVAVFYRQNGFAAKKRLLTMACNNSRRLTMACNNSRLNRQFINLDAIWVR